MSFKEMENMMYKIEGEDLYLIGTSEHSMIGKFIDTINDEETLPQTSPATLRSCKGKSVRTASRSAAFTASTSSRSRKWSSSASRRTARYWYEKLAEHGRFLPFARYSVRTLSAALATWLT